MRHNIEEEHYETQETRVYHLGITKFTNINEVKLLIINI